MKKNIFKVVCLAAILFSTASMAQAQFRQSIFLDGVLPVGSFASSATYNDVPFGMKDMGKEAMIGFGMGYRVSYRFDVGMGEVAPFAQADIFWNTIDGNWKDKFAGHQYSTPNYFNVPVMLGVSYLYDELWNDITLFGEFGLGGDFFFITHEGTGKGNERFAYKPTCELAWMVGAGAYFGQHVSAGIYYYGLGKHYIDYTDKTIDNNSVAAIQAASYTLANKRESRTLGELAIRIGFHF